MREIKFRGRSIYTNDWVYGSYLPAYYESKFYIVAIHGIESGVTEFEMIEVIPESVGQFTGLKDKNGVEIYEGDIEKEYGEIEDMMEFYLYINFNAISNDDLEIIGNIHENEL